ncbi:hypothetical protein HanLR1_Chr00c0091g0708631 [Helianthus annuus]|nr:hypothetical protein HanLR1_Chr00c0091g0708631 [Helianthus annuus]
MVAVNNNQGQPGTTNHNRALAVQADEGCDWSVQFGEGDQGSGTALYAKVIEQVHKEESSGSDDSSGYSGSSDEEGSVSGDNHSEPDEEEGEDIQDLLNEADELKCQKSILIRKAAATSTEMEKLFSEDRAFSFQTAFMANGSASTSQILKDRRTWSMTSFGMKTRREGAQKMKMIELPLAIINTTRISLHKDKVFSRA